jgi:hypothetical protein
LEEDDDKQAETIKRGNDWRTLFGDNGIMRDNGGGGESSLFW